MKKMLQFCAVTIGVAFAACLSLSLSSCTDDDNITKSPGNYHYEQLVPNSDATITVVLDSISSPVKSIGNCPDWATVTSAEGMTDGHPVLNISVKRSDADTPNSAEVVVFSENNDKVTLLLKQYFRLLDDDNSGGDTFATDWETMDSVTIYSNGRHQKVNLPWATMSATTLPSDIRADVKKDDGWEMAFSVLNNEGLEDCNYFALYNRYLGLLRVFHFVSNSSTTGSKYSFEVNMGTPNKDCKFPFYHALTYGIPSSHTSLPMTMNLLNDGTASSNTFKSFHTPYTSMTSTALTRGWTAFDIDMSAYCPTNTNWFNSGEDLSFSCKTELLQKVSLEGTLEANISGKYSSAEQTASASSGVSSLLKMASGVLGDVSNSALAAIQQQLTGSSWNVYSLYASTACNLAAYAYDWAVSNPYAKNITDSMPGKIQMSMTGDINLSGYISSLASNSVTPLTMNTSILSKYKSNVGKGVWSLADDPVVYVVDDRILGDVETMNMVVKGDGTYGCPAAEDYHLRMVSFFDPTSLKLNINPEVFPDVSDVKVVCNYGVYTGEKGGHTAQYAKLMSLDRPKLDIVKDGEKMSIYRSTSSSNKTKYLYLPHTKFKSAQLEETDSNCTVIKQEGANYYYYGRNMTTAEVPDIKNFMISPQVYLPYNISEGKLYDGEMPDFVVTVSVSFKSGKDPKTGEGRNFIFSQRFLPKIVKISAADLSAKYNELKSYSDKCKAKQDVNTLQTNGSVGVKHINGDAAVQKTLDILKAVIDYK